MDSVIGIVGYSNSGKTEFLEKLIPQLKQADLKVGVIKHHHQDFTIDKPGKDSWRHTQAGADQVILSSPNKVALIKKTAKEMALTEIVTKYMDGVDVILVEGYKYSNIPKIEIYRPALGKKRISQTGNDNLLGLVINEESSQAEYFSAAEVQRITRIIINYCQNN
ncbi:MAG: molybdopterin-guanine dinucleotide biosynthesis protein B [Bacillota bacterium]